MRVNEIFPAVQGEGRNQGSPCVFLRLAVCNLHCHFCDTFYTWNFGKGDGEMRHGLPTVKQANEVHEMNLAEIATRLTHFKRKHLVISGGEPMLQQDELMELLSTMAGWEIVEVETNGTIAPKEFMNRYVTQWNVSPKLASSGNVRAVAIRPDVLRAFQATGKATFKFVVQSREDALEVKQLAEECGLTDVWLMPEGASRERQMETLPMAVELAQEFGWHVTSRMHVMAYGTKRGV